MRFCFIALAKPEWDDKLAPRVVEAEQAAKEITESSRSVLSELIAKLEDFLVHLRARTTKGDEAPQSAH